MERRRSETARRLRSAAEIKGEAPQAQHNVYQDCSVSPFISPWGSHATGSAYSVRENGACFASGCRFDTRTCAPRDKGHASAAQTTRAKERGESRGEESTQGAARRSRTRRHRRAGGNKEGARRERGVWRDLGRGGERRVDPRALSTRHRRYRCVRACMPSRSVPTTETREEEEAAARGT
eukprot:2305183-Rhodomonas_salina.2